MVKTILIIAGMAAFVALLWLVVVPQHWRGRAEAVRNDRMSAEMILGRGRASAGLARSGVAFVVAASLIILGAAGVLLFQNIVVENAIGRSVSFVIFGFGVVLLFVLPAAIVVFNRPKFLIAPHYRRHSGLWRKRK
ncbi:hypothetical protein LX16_0050 [Stackebrandtia albiflava]|uniref:Uncharacterized protein n=1 Tax=Stackebrandtia albiflava TaxID=406432 RepID=A0A562VH29_9ACTN|nr:hypothetical protein [Stackebrandtia albiflava]TWJ17134.1 hypothetical protein LX16_0050 [Stackebrandtia albiflava]